jgi:hypothetical protein
MPQALIVAESQFELSAPRRPAREGREKSVQLERNLSQRFSLLSDRPFRMMPAGATSYRRGMEFDRSSYTFLRAGDAVKWGVRPEKNGLALTGEPESRLR